MTVDRIDTLAPCCAFCGEVIGEPADLRAVLRMELPWTFGIHRLELEAHPRCLLAVLNHRWQHVLGDEPERRPV